MRMLSHIASKMRGSVGGLTYLSNSYHQIVCRIRTTPTNPMTGNQTTARSAFAGAQTSWRLATQVIRDGWDAYAASCHYSGPLGSYTVPGRQMFTSVFQLIHYIIARGLAAAAPVWTTASPVTGGFLNISDIVAVAPTGPGTGIAISVSNLEAFAALAFIQISRPFEATRMSYKGPWDTTLTGTMAKLCPATVSTKIEILTLTVAKVYFVRIRMISNVAPFKLGPQYILRCVAVTVP